MERAKGVGVLVQMHSRLRLLVMAAFIIPVLLGWGTFLVASGSVQTTPSDDLCDLARDRAEAVSGKTIEFDVAEYSGIGELPQAAYEEFLTKRTEYAAFIAPDGRFWLRTTCLFRSSRLGGGAGSSETMVWNGVDFRSLGESSDQKSYGATIYSTPSRLLSHRQCLSWLGWWMFQLPSRVTLSDLACRASKSVPRVDGGVNTWECPFPEWDGVVFSCSVDSDKGTIRSYAIDGFGEVEIGTEVRRTLRASVVVKLGDDLVSPELPLPRTARIEHHHLEQGRWGLREVTYRAHSHGPPSEHWNELRFPTGTLVSDQRYRLAYELGDNRLNIDGRLLITPDPLKGDVGNELPLWVNRGQFVELGGTPTLATPSPKLSQWIVFLLIGISMAIGAKVLAARKGNARC